MARPIRLLVADDHPVVRDGLAAILATQADFELVGQAGDGAEAVDQAVRLQPDVLLLDLEMPGMDGVEVLHRLKEAAMGVRTVVLTAYDSDERIVAAVKAGAQGYLLKGVPREEIFAAVRVVHRGGSLLQPVVASKLLRRVSDGLESLTPRELEVLALLARGLSNREIAAELIVTERTIKFHVSSILAKLGADNRTEAVSTAVQRGLISL